LVIVGPSGFEASRVHDAIREHRLTDRVRWMGYLPDADLAALYNAAIALVYPSVYEGFGLPAVEAMACGCPVIAANTSSLPEVVGDAGFLVDPYDVPALTQVIERVIADEAFARSLRARGLARASTFSWRRSAEAAVAIYRDVLRSGHAAGRR
jgi:glycosyltransferase involved in cell wall biosynthesis